MKNISAILIVFISILALNACNNTPASVMEDTWVEIKDTTHLPDIDTLDGYWEEFRGLIVRNSEEYSTIPKRIIDTTYRTCLKIGQKYDSARNMPKGKMIY